MAASGKMIAIGATVAIVQFGVSILCFGGWTAYFSHPALITLLVITLAMMSVAPFSQGNLSSGEQEDRGNRWVFIAFTVIALLSAIVPPYSDRIGFATIDGERTRWAGLVLYTLGGALRLWPVFVLGRRFSGLVAIQSGHALETHGPYRLIRNPSYLGMIINMLGSGLVAARPARRTHPFRRTPPPRPLRCQIRQLLLPHLAPRPRRLLIPCHRVHPRSCQGLPVSKISHSLHSKHNFPAGTLQVISIEKRTMVPYDKLSQKPQFP